MCLSEAYNFQVPCGHPCSLTGPRIISGDTIVGEKLSKYIRMKNIPNKPMPKEFSFFGFLDEFKTSGCSLEIQNLPAIWIRAGFVPRTSAKGWELVGLS